MAVELYKPDQATKSRGGIAILIAALLGYGVVSLYDYLAMGFWQDDLTSGMLGDEFPISPRVVLCGILTVLCAIAIYVAYNNKKAVDFLISTEIEMTKVSWPTWHEVRDSSIVVCITVVILAVYLGLVDYGLALFTQQIPWDQFWTKVFS